MKKNYLNFYLRALIISVISGLFYFSSVSAAIIPALYCGDANGTVVSEFPANNDLCKNGAYYIQSGFFDGKYTWVCYINAQMVSCSATKSSGAIVPSIVDKPFGGFTYSIPKIYDDYGWGNNTNVLFEIIQRNSNIKVVVPVIDDGKKKDLYLTNLKGVQYYIPYDVDKVNCQSYWDGKIGFSDPVRKYLDVFCFGGCGPFNGHNVTGIIVKAYSSLTGLLPGDCNGYERTFECRNGVWSGIDGSKVSDYPFLTCGQMCADFRVGHIGEPIPNGSYVTGYVSDTSTDCLSTSKMFLCLDSIWTGGNTSSYTYPNCTQVVAYTGVCGTSSGITTSVFPMTNLCSGGNSNVLDLSGDDGYFNWNCTGANGGATASCSATKIYLGYTCQLSGGAPRWIPSGINSVTKSNTGAYYMGSGIYTSSPIDSGYVCYRPVNGLCSATHYGCLSGSSTSNSSLTNKYTWDCAGLYYGTDASCTECKTGYINPPSCDAGTCNGSIPANAEMNVGVQLSGFDWTYSVTSGVCLYKCSSGYHTEDGGITCISNIQTRIPVSTNYPTSLLGTNWYRNTVSTITQTRTWNVVWSAWAPTSGAVKNSVSSSVELRYNCYAGYTGTNCDLTIANGSCGASNGQTYTNPPATINLCSGGTNTGVTANPSSYDWTCTGANGGVSVVCSANRLIMVTGNCGSANGVNTVDYPSTNHCTAGNQQAIDITGADNIYNWNCTGANGGGTASCSAIRLYKYYTCQLSGGAPRWIESLGTSVTKSNLGSYYVGSGIYASFPIDVGYACYRPVNGVCNTVHYNCLSGSSVNNSSVSNKYTWDCAGLYYGTDASCTECQAGYINPPSCDPGTCGGTRPGNTDMNTGIQLSGYNWEYSVTAGICKYKCSTNFHLSGSSCVSDTETRAATCTAYPTSTFGVNWYWNTVNNITQTRTWNGASWNARSPTSGSVKSVSASATECRYNCYAGYTGSNCDLVVVNGVCNATTELGSTYVAPSGSSNLCTSGSAGSVTTNATTYTWTCAGINGGNSDSCTSYRKVDGACGSANGVPVSSYPISNHCGTGTKLDVDISGIGGYFDWTCQGINSGVDASCSAQKISIVTGACGSASGQATYSYPSGNKCTAGAIIDTDPTGSDNVYNWTCQGTNAPDMSCSAPRIVDGSCNSAHYLCNAGNSISNNFASNKYTWICQGINLGTNASCSECNTSYHFSGSSCVSNTETRQATCVGKISNSDRYNTTITQTRTWNGASRGSWYQSSGGSYNATQNTSYCYYGCSAGFVWNGSNCVAATYSGYVCTAQYSPTCVGVWEPTGTTNTTKSTAGTYKENNIIYTDSTAGYTCDPSEAGKCGTANGVTSYNFPASNILCASGDVVSQTTTATSFTWNCNGKCGSTSNASCSAPRRIDGVCGTANGQTKTIPGGTTTQVKDAFYASGLCNYSSVTRLASDITTNDPKATWSCANLNGGTNAACTGTYDIAQSNCTTGYNIDSKNGGGTYTQIPIIVVGTTGLANPVHSSASMPTTVYTNHKTTTSTTICSGHFSCPSQGAVPQLVIASERCKTTSTGVCDAGYYLDGSNNCQSVCQAGNSCGGGYSRTSISGDTWSCNYGYVCTSGAKPTVACPVACPANTYRNGSSCVDTSSACGGSDYACNKGSSIGNTSNTCGKEWNCQFIDCSSNLTGVNCGNTKCGAGQYRNGSTCATITCSAEKPPYPVASFNYGATISYSSGDYSRTTTCTLSCGGTCVDGGGLTSENCSTLCNAGYADVAGNCCPLRCQGSTDQFKVGIDRELFDWTYCEDYSIDGDTYSVLDYAELGSCGYGEPDAYGNIAPGYIQFPDAEQGDKVWVKAGYNSTSTTTTYGWQETLYSTTVTVGKARDGSTPLNWIQGSYYDIYFNKSLNSTTCDAGSIRDLYYVTDGSEDHPIEQEVFNLIPKVYATNPPVWMKKSCRAITSTKTTWIKPQVIGYAYQTCQDYFYSVSSCPISKCSISPNCPCSAGQYRDPNSKTCEWKNYSVKTNANFAISYDCIGRAGVYPDCPSGYQPLGYPAYHVNTDKPRTSCSALWWKDPKFTLCVQYTYGTRHYGESCLKDISSTYCRDDGNCEGLTINTPICSSSNLNTCYPFRGTENMGTVDAYGNCN